MFQYLVCMGLDTLLNITAVRTRTIEARPARAANRHASGTRLGHETGDRYLRLFSRNRHGAIARRKD